MLSLAPIALLSIAGEQQPVLSPYAVESNGRVAVRAELRAAPDLRFGVTVALGARGELPLAAGRTGPDGVGLVHLATFDAAEFAALGAIELRGWYVDTRTGTPTATAWAGLGEGENALCERMSFNVAPGDTLLPGLIIDDEYVEAGVTISAESGDPMGPDAVILFDSANPTGDDPDLVTPGYGVGNTEPLGNLLIIAEDVVDLDNDGLVDDPDDAAAGGTITFDFARPVRMCGMGLLDLDKGGIGSTIHFYDDAGVQIREFLLPSLGDNSFQEISFDARGVARVEVTFVSSGAIPFMDFVPCPTSVDFEQNTFGLDLETEAGQIVSGQGTGLDAGLPFDVDVQNLGAGPDTAILFDTDDPTGGDFDLGQARTGLVLIVAENTTDLNGDGLVDEPDDEAGGGVLRLEFPSLVSIESMTVLDIDADETASIEYYDETNALIGVTPLLPAGDGSVQSVAPGVQRVMAVELRMSGSGALAEIEICPVQDISS